MIAITTIDYNDSLRKCKSGNVGAREDLFRHLRVRLLSILKYRLRGWPTEEIEDILQDTMTVLAEKLDQVESNPDLFALDILRNKIGNRVNRRRRRIEVSLHPTDSSDDREKGRDFDSATSLIASDTDLAGMESEDIAEAIRHAIWKLSPLCQALFAALLDNRSVADTWELMQHTEQGLPRSTFDKRLFDCRKKLRKLLAHTL